MKSFFYRYAQFFMGFGFGLVLAGGLMLAGSAKDTPPSRAEIEALARSYGMVYKDEVLVLGGTGGNTPPPVEPQEPVEQEPQPIRVYIPWGTTSEEIAVILAQEKDIRDPEVFSERVRARGVSTKLRAGYYDFTPDLTVDEIIDLLLIPGKEASQ